MSEHFWLSPVSRPITTEMAARLSESEARVVLEEMYWGVRGKQVCPQCGVLDRHYKVALRGQYRCKEKGCGHTFSVTSATPFKDRKLSHRKLLMAMLFFTTGHKGRAATDLCREIGVSYRTAFVLFHKLREGIMWTASQNQLADLVQIDGGHFSGRPRKGRRKFKHDPAIPAKYRQHRAKYPAQAFIHHPNRRIVMVLREIGKPREGATRTLVAICRTENGSDAEALVRKYVKLGSTIHTDEWKAYANLEFMGYPHATVNHQVEFSTDDGVSDNQAESFFSRMRRAVNGIYHRVTPRYMLDYASEMAWREDVRRKTTLQQLKILVQRVFGSGLSRDWRGYWQGYKRQVELLFSS